MQLLLIRHGVAEEREDFAKTGLDDSQRPLTKTGKWKMQHVAKGLRRTVRSIDVLASSPLVRAMQTAKIVAERYRGVEVEVLDALQPENEYQEFLAWLRKQKSAEVVAAVGHEPHLGGLATWLLVDRRESHTPLGKGGACLLEFNARPSAGGARLMWSALPSMLRELGK